LNVLKLREEVTQKRHQFKPSFWPNSHLDDISLFGSRPVFTAGILVSLKLDLDLARNGQIHPHVLPDGHDLVLLLRISGPNRQFVSLGTNVDHGAADLIGIRFDNLAYQTHKGLLPILVQFAAAPLLALKIQQPPATLDIAWILPHWFDAFLEKRIITAWLKVRRRLQEVVESPEILDRVARGDQLVIVLPFFGLVVLEIPHGPSVLQRVLGGSQPGTRRLDDRLVRHRGTGSGLEGLGARAIRRVLATRSLPRLGFPRLHGGLNALHYGGAHRETINSANSILTTTLSK